MFKVKATLLVVFPKVLQGFLLLTLLVLGQALMLMFAVLLLPAIQQVPTPEAAQVIDPSGKELGHKLMNPYVVTLEVLALLLTAALIGAVTAAQGVRMPKEEDSQE